MKQEDPVAYNSMTEGDTEVGERLLRGLLRSVKLCLGQRIDKQIPVDHPMIAWMMEHASLLPNALVRGTDGLAAWKRVRGRNFGQPTVGCPRATGRDTCSSRRSRKDHQWHSPNSAQGK